MHFLVFMFLFIMIAVSGGTLLYIVCAFWKDVGEMRWEWLPIHLVAGPVVSFILYYFVDLMTKFVNA